MSNFQKVAGGLDVAPLLAELAAQPELWGHITARQDAPGSAHHGTQAIFLRWCAGQTAFDAFNDVDAVDYAAALVLPEAVKLVQQALQHIPHSRLGRILIVNLKAGESIDEHMDEGVYADTYDRFHISLQSDEGNTFHVGRKEFHALPGELWWFNHKLTHRVVNASSRDRLHIILDVVAPDYRALRGTYFQRERAHDLFQEIGPLLQLHYDEIAHYHDIPLDPDVATYCHLEDVGQLRCYTARVNGDLVGYAVFKVGNNMHYRGSKQANQAVLFVLPAYREKRVGYRLIKHCDAQLKAEGVQVVYQRTKAAHSFGPLLEHMGYVPEEMVYSKRLDKECS